MALKVIDSYEVKNGSFTVATIETYKAPNNYCARININRVLGYMYFKFPRYMYGAYIEELMDIVKKKNHFADFKVSSETSDNDYTLTFSNGRMSLIDVSNNTVFSCNANKIAKIENTQDTDIKEVDGFEEHVHV